MINEMKMSLSVAHLKRNKMAQKKDTKTSYLDFVFRSLAS